MVGGDLPTEGGLSAGEGTCKGGNQENGRYASYWNALLKSSIWILKTSEVCAGSEMDMVSPKLILLTIREQTCTAINNNLRL